MPVTGLGAAARTARSSAARDRVLLAVCGLIVGGSRWWATRNATFPYISADEPAYLSMARWLGGRGGWNLGEAAVYGPGYSFLLAPWAALQLPPDTQYRAAILTNVALGVVAFVVLERLVRRVTTLERPWTIPVALVGSMTASAVLLTGYAWSDSLAVLVFLVTTLACVTLVEGPTPGRGVATAGIAVVAFAVHYRFAPLVVVVIALLVVLARSRRLDLRAGLGAIGTAVVGVGLVQLLSQVIHGRLYEGGGAGSQTSSFLGLLADPFDVLIAAAGQVWYLSVTTAGLATLGAVALIAGAPGRPGGHGPFRSPATARTVLTLVFVTFLASAVFMSGGERGDHAIYGRYNDAFAGLLIALGVVRLVARRPLRDLLVDVVVVIGTLVACWALVASTRADQLRVPYNGLTIRSLVPLGGGGSTQLDRFTVVGAVLTLAVLLTAVVFRRRAAPVICVVVVLALLGAGRAVHRTDGVRENDPRAAASLVGVVDASDRVAFILDPSIRSAAFFRFPFYAPELRMFRTEDPVWEQGAPWIMAPADFAPVVDAGYEAVWSDPVSGQRLWRATD